MKKFFTLVAVTMLAALNLQAHTSDSPEDALAFFGLSPCECCSLRAKRKCSPVRRQNLLFCQKTMLHGQRKRGDGATPILM